MAVIWSCEREGRRYEVRSAGRTRRLYTDGVFHSQYNEAHGVTGGVWDLLLLPAFLLEPAPVRVLVLGVGGGTVLRMLRSYLAPPMLIGVDLDPVHLTVAREHFGVPDGVELVAADARDWVAGYEGASFDLIIEDLFGGAGEPERAVALDAAWTRQLLGLLAPGGALVANFIEPAELRRAAPYSDGTLRRRFARGLQFTTELDTNAVGAFFRQQVDPRRLRARLNAEPTLDTRRRGCRLRYRMRRLW